MLEQIQNDTYKMVAIAYQEILSFIFIQNPRDWDSSRLQLTECMYSNITFKQNHDQIVWRSTRRLKKRSVKFSKHLTFMLWNILLAHNEVKNPQATKPGLLLGSWSGNYSTALKLLKWAQSKFNLLQNTLIWQVLLHIREASKRNAKKA